VLETLYGASGMERGGWNKLSKVLLFAYFGANQPERSESMCAYENKHEHITKSPCAGDRGALKNCIIYSFILYEQLQIIY